MIDSSEESGEPFPDIDPSDIRREDLFRYGTVARISGIQGQKSNDLILVLEGVKRMKLNKFTQRRPFFAADVTLITEGERYRPVRKLGHYC